MAIARDEGLRVGVGHFRGRDFVANLNDRVTGADTGQGAEIHFCELIGPRRPGFARPDVEADDEADPAVGLQRGGVGREGGGGIQVADRCAAPHGRHKGEEVRIETDGEAERVHIAKAFQRDAQRVRLAPGHGEVVRAEHAIRTGGLNGEGEGQRQHPRLQQRVQTLSHFKLVLEFCFARFRYSSCVLGKT